MKVKDAFFITSATRPDQYPEHKLPEIAFAGRSNVGKSSLINSLVGRHGLVKVSKTPGKTRLLNFFDINGKTVFVDMPGYGFAKVPLSVKKTWGKMAEIYLQQRKILKAVILLLDCRRKPADDDRRLIDWFLHYQVPFILVITKIDKIPKTHRRREIKKVMEAISDLVGEDFRPMVYSSHTGEGKKELWRVIGEVISD